jgi:hypothetical protein
MANHKNRRKGKVRVPSSPKPLVRPGAPLWKRFPKIIWGLVAAAGVLVSPVVLYPWLSANQDFFIQAPNPFGVQNPYDASFSVSDEGYLPLEDLSVSCKAHITLVPSDLHSMPLLPLDTAKVHEHFASRLIYKHRVSLPCMGNIVANGHVLTPDSTLTLAVSYRVWLIPIRRTQTFQFRTLVDSGGHVYWLYQD